MTDPYLSHYQSYEDPYVPDAATKIMLVERDAQDFLDCVVWDGYMMEQVMDVLLFWWLKHWGVYE
jgi:hypothetical protein